MLKHIKKLLKANALFIAIVITIFIAIISLARVDKVASRILLLQDKLNHLIAYFFLTLSWFYALHQKKFSPKNTRHLILCCILYGIFIEVLQSILTSYRTASYLDILANSVGVVIGALAFHFFEKKIEVF
tara:strand:- start:430 stop:819 length:390 start_codon:yes stop_codon:yes gene_type:complete